MYAYVCIHSVWCHYPMCIGEHWWKLLPRGDEGHLYVYFELCIYVYARIQYTSENLFHCLLWPEPLDLSLTNKSYKCVCWMWKNANIYDRSIHSIIHKTGDIMTHSTRRSKAIYEWRAKPSHAHALCCIHDLQPQLSFFKHAAYNFGLQFTVIVILINRSISIICVWLRFGDFV